MAIRCTHPHDHASTPSCVRARASPAVEERVLREFQSANEARVIAALAATYMYIQTFAIPGTIFMNLRTLPQLGRLCCRLAPVRGPPATRGC